MPTFTAGEVKIRPGEYHRVENAGGVTVASANNGIVAGVIRANWGPLNKVLTLAPSSDVKAIYGAGNGTTENLITEMFKGGGTTGYFVRVGTGGTKATITLKDTTAEEAVNAVTIQAKYVGSRAFTVTVRDSLTNTSNRECIIYDGTSEFEKVTFEKNASGGEAAALVAAFASSANFTATKVADGNGTLATVAQSAFTAGTDPTVNAEAYSNALIALEPYIFNVLCVDTEDTSIHELVAAFINRTYAAGSYPMTVLSEAASVDLATRIAHAKAFNNAKIIYLLNSAVDSSGTTRAGYIAAARIGGIIAAVPSNRSVTHYVVSGYTDLNEGLTNTQIEAAIKAGCLVLTKNAEGDVWIEQGINTLTTPSDDEDEGWKKIRRVKTRFELMQRVGDSFNSLIGSVNNDSDGRSAFLTAAQAVIDDMVAEKKLLAGSSIVEDTNNPPTSDSAWFVIAVNDVDSIEKVYITYRYRFAPEE